jgi:hypothetical protein
MDRITNKQLSALCEWLNEITDSPAEPYTQIDGKLRANIGNYHISGAYGGVCLHRMMNESGGVNTPLSSGHGTKRELFEQMHAYIRGIELGKYWIN